MKDAAKNKKFKNNSMRFGESFPQGADKKNRMDVLKPEGHNGGNPEYINFGWEIRNKLREQIKKEGWPKLPDPKDIKGVEDIFETAKNKVNKTWGESVQGMIQGKAEKWITKINNEDPESSSAIDILKNPEELATSLRLNQLSRLETLRQPNPEAWRSLNIASAERQMASIAILEHWLKDKNNDSALDRISAKIGLGREELKLFVDLAGILGKYVDQAFIKQTELADLPGGSKETKLIDEQGSQYIYDLYKPNDDKVEVKTYKEIFPFEFVKIQNRLQILSKETKEKSEVGLLPTEYKNFGEYLDSMSKVYGSDNTNLETLDDEWSNLYKEGSDLNKTTCPIMLIPQGAASVTGDAGKVDIEMRLGLKTAETRHQEKEFEMFRNIAQELVDAHKDSLKEESKIPEVTFNYQPWAFGPNLNSVTSGESEKSQILVHSGADKEIVREREMPVLRNVFSGEKFDFNEYLKAVVNENTLHEIGHNVLESEDKNIHKKIGGSFESGMLEELKAETIGMKILMTAEQRGTLSEQINLRNQLLAKIGTNLNYLKNNSSKKGSDGEEYFICGVAIIGRLLEKGLITPNDKGYELGETKDCLNEIASISEQVLPFYVNKDSRPSDVKAYINDLRKKTENPALKKFIKNLHE